ncbi:MAG: aminopeptidase [Nanoarchaeota archaeon]|nr:aminopeptidase [Nanoarchaeota archaeon]
MKDKRVEKLAKLVIDWSVFVKKDENVMISASEDAKEFVKALYKAVLKKGAYPQLKYSPEGLTPIYYENASMEQIGKFPEIHDMVVKKIQKYIGIGTGDDRKEMEKLDPKKVAMRTKITNPISSYVVNEKPKIYRCSMGFPSKKLAKEAGMSLKNYSNFLYGACLQDWKKESKRMKKILDKFKKGKEVHLIGKGVDLKMKIHGKKAVMDDGKENMPGGEIFMAPVRNSLKGYIKFEWPSIRDGKEVKDIYLRFKGGKVVKEKASKNLKFLTTMLNTDKNARYVGELGIGMNPKVTKPTNELLFDEKIGGTIHLALGMAYKENGGGNDSAIHWDIVKDMKHAKIVLDGKVVQERGKWKV